MYNHTDIDNYLPSECWSYVGGLSVCLSVSVCVKAFPGAGEVVQQLKAIATLAEDPGLISSSHICIFTYRISVAPADLLRLLHACGAHTYT